MNRLGIITAGGDAPGMNAAIRAVVRSALYENFEVIGFRRGYEGLISQQTIKMQPRTVSGIINLGGTILKTRRCDIMKTSNGIEKAVVSLEKNKIEALIIIGGDGSFEGAKKIHEASGIPIVGIPATIDNDIDEVPTETTE